MLYLFVYSRQKRFTLCLAKPLRTFAAIALKHVASSKGCSIASNLGIVSSEYRFRFSVLCADGRD
jgi:hypothetical protein